MAHHHANKFPALELPIDLFVRTGSIHALKKALTEHELVESFSDYLIDHFQENLRRTDLTQAAHTLIDLVHEFAGNVEQQTAVMALLSHTKH